MNDPIRISVVGAGLIGRRHIEVMAALRGCVELDSVVDPSEEGRAYAEDLEIDWYPSLEEMFAAVRPDGTILATPNQVHLQNGLACVAAKCPMLMEKPIATSSAAAKELVDSARRADVPILVGHHRRHNPIIRHARAVIEQGRLGRITSVHGIFWTHKPDPYFETEWRRKKDAGPIMVNAIHDIDLLRYLCGDVDSVHSFSSNEVRGFEAEDTSVVLIRFKSGALGTFNASDTVTSPWSWENTSGENPDYAQVQQSCYLIGGTDATLSVPDLKVWQYTNDWKSPIRATSFPMSMIDPLALEPLVAQIRHFANVIRGQEPPLVSGEEGMKSLAVIEAIKRSAKSGETVYL